MSVGRKGKNQFSHLFVVFIKFTLPWLEKSPLHQLCPRNPPETIVTHSHTALRNKDIATQDTTPGEPHPEALAVSWWLFALCQISCISRNGCNAGSALMPLHLALLYHLFFSWVHFLCVALAFSAFTSLLRYLKQLLQSLFLVGASVFIFFPTSFCDFSFSAFISVHLFFLFFFLFPVFPAPLSRKDALLGLIDGPLETDIKEGRRDRETGDLFHKQDASMVFKTSVAPYKSTREYMESREEDNPPS